MLEIPEAASLARNVTDTLCGKTVKEAIADFSPHRLAWYYEDPRDYAGLLQGQTLQQARPVGGMLELLTERCHILFAEGVTLRLVQEGQKTPPRHQLRLLFHDGLQLFASIQMYGGIWAFPTGALQNPYYEVAGQKPSPLSEAFSENYFAGLFRPEDEKLSAKAFLATEQRIPGLGNGVLQDILFAAKIHPKTKVRQLSRPDRHRLYGVLRDVLQTMTDQGGRDTEKNLWGQAGGYPTQMSRKTYGRPCPTCATPIERQDYMGGKVYFCPQCQKLS